MIEELESEVFSHLPDPHSEEDRLRDDFELEESAGGHTMYPMTSGSRHYISSVDAHFPTSLPQLDMIEEQVRKLAARLDRP